MQESFSPNVIPFSSMEGVAQIARQKFVVYSSLKHQRYAELDFFRQQVEESKAGLHHQPYTSRKKHTARYKCIFFGFAFLFFLLTVMTMAIPSAVGCGFLFSSCTILKGLIVTLSTTLSLSSFSIALSLKTEKEAIVSLVKKVKAHLAAIHARKQMRMGIKGSFPLFGKERHAAIGLRQAYQEMLDAINDRKEETLHLVHRITTAETLPYQEKEDLLNQAIEELHDKLQHLLHGFRHGRVS